MTNDDKPTQLQLFPNGSDDPSNAQELQQEVSKYHYREVSKTYISLRAERITIDSAFQDINSSLTLPRRWEFCVNKAEELDTLSALLNTVRPPTRALEELASYIDLLKSSSGEGALWIFNGDSGSGKTTFLQTLEHQINARRNQKILEVQVIHGHQIDLTNRLEAFRILHDKVDHRTGKEIVLVLILEDVEQSLTDNELEGLSQALKMLLRSPTPHESKNVLVVIPVNNQKHGLRLRNAADEIGLLSRDSGKSSLYIFEGPKEDQYIEIVEDLTRVLNNRPLADFGIRTEVLEKIPRRRITIGNFIQNVAEFANNQDQRTIEVLQENQYKKLVTIFAFVRPMHPTDLYNSVQLVVSDRSNRLSSEWLLSEAGAESNQWKDKPEKLAAIVNNILHIKAVELPPHVLNQMIQMCGDPAFQDGLKSHFTSAGINPAKPRNWTNVRDSIFSTNLMRLLLGQQTTRPSHVGLNPQAGEKPETSKKRELLTKGILTAKWITKKSQYDINGTVAMSLKQVLTSGTQAAHLEGFQGIWAEGVLSIEKSDGTSENTIRPDITIETPDTLYLIELNYENGAVLTRADMARYIMKKINSYYKQLPILRQFVNV